MYYSIINRKMREELTQRCRHLKISWSRRSECLWRVAYGVSFLVLVGFATGIIPIQNVPDDDVQAFAARMPGLKLTESSKDGATSRVVRSANGTRVYHDGDLHWDVVHWRHAATNSLGIKKAFAMPSPGCFVKLRLSAPPGIMLNCTSGLEVKRNMDLLEARDIYYRHMRRTSATCLHSELLGHQKDGGWWACKESPFLLKPPCLVYSFGIGNDWSFDDAISTRYGCEVHAFDPSIGLTQHKHTELVSFYSMGLGGRDEINKDNWTVRTFCSYLKMLGHEKRIIDYLKFDVEYAEWSAMVAMVREGCLKNVKQLGFELHGWADDVANYTLFWEGLQGLENAGFQKWRVSNRDYLCFEPKDDPANRRCPQADLNYINIHHMGSVS